MPQVVTLRLSDGDTVSLDANEQQMHIDPTDEQIVSVDLESAEKQLYISQIEPQDIYPQTVKKIWTGTCSTAISTATKDVTLDDATGFSLTNGTTIAVYFSAGNSANSPKLNVNSTGAVSVYYYKNGSGYAIYSEYIKTWGPGIMFFTYYSQKWVMRFADAGLVQSVLVDKADKNSPPLTGTPTAPTAATGTNTTQIATTAFVQQELGAKALTASGDGTVTLSIGG